MAKVLKIRDLTLRDGQQSSFATRMTQAQVERCLPFYKDAQFFAMEVWGGAVPELPSAPASTPPPDPTRLLNTVPLDLFHFAWACSALAAAMAPDAAPPLPSPVPPAKTVLTAQFAASTTDALNSVIFA